MAQTPSFVLDDSGPGQPRSGRHPGRGLGGVLLERHLATIEQAMHRLLERGEMPIEEGALEAAPGLVARPGLAGAGVV